MLVTSVDGIVNLSDVVAADAIAKWYAGSVRLGAGLVVPGSAIPELQEVFGLFRGFDEVSCINTAPVLPKPADVVIVAPLNLKTDEVPPRLHAWMAESKSQLGPGDGSGINYVTPNKDLCRVLEETVASWEHVP